MRKIEFVIGRQLGIICTLFVVLNVSYGQKTTFEWADSTFAVGQKRVVQLDFDFDGPCTLKPCYEYRSNSLTIDTILAFLLRNPDLQIEIGSHQEQLGNKDFNQEISERWAKGTMDELINRGAPEEKLTYKGYGDLQPIISVRKIRQMTTREEKLAAYLRNRRIEILILKI